MSAFLIAAVLAAQPPMFGNGPPPSAPPPPHELPYGREAARNGSPRQVLHAFGACVAERNALVTDAIVRMEPGSRRIGQRLNEVVRRDRDCFRQTGGRMAFEHLAIVGAMAEHLVERDRSPLNARLARAALRPAPETRPGTDRIAICVARSVPDQMAALLATTIDSAEETQAVQALEPAIIACNQTRMRFTVTTAGARAMLATAAYRSLHGAD